MGTRSTVKFYRNNECVLSVYQQYDGYISGVGRQLADLLSNYKIVNGIGINKKEPVANGMSELALFYVLDNKDGSGNLYATTENDYQEFNYKVYADFKNGKDDIFKVVVDGDDLEFEGTKEDFCKFVEEYN